MSRRDHFVTKGLALLRENLCFYPDYSAKSGSATKWSLRESEPRSSPAGPKFLKLRKLLMPETPGISVTFNLKKLL
jgi:hypothetical protein